MSTKTSPRMSSKAKGKQPQRAVAKGPKKSRREEGAQVISALQDRVNALDARGNYKAFEDLPLCSATLAGLKNANYTTLTPIQAKALPLAIKGHDVLGAARTGSGKTLAFLIPILEVLYRKKWGPMDGLGALIISPTRELAVQIFEVLKKIGGMHTFSAGLIIGGKNLKDEKERLSGMNILVATPGRLLQHMDQTVGFEADNLQMLVLDEADRILDLGFASALNAIVANLPEERQTLLFSATQTKSIKDLARLSLNEPEYVSVHAQASTEESNTNLDVPASLSQHYLVVNLDEKLNRLWSFIKTHLYQKTIVFLSSCKQVRFVYECFRQLRPGVPLLHLHGKQKQMQRLEIYNRFAQSEHACLFATDVAARGLDFPNVGWVVQCDCPEDVDTYVHRVGRTARYTAKGKALMFLLPSEEEGMVKRLEGKGVKVEQIKVRDSQQKDVRKQLQSLAFRSTDIKFLAQRAFISYVRSIYLQKDKRVFKLDELPLEAFALSLGLAGAPQLKFHSKADASTKKNAPRTVNALQDDQAEGEVDASSEEEQETKNVFGTVSGGALDAEEKDQTAKTKYDRMFARKNQNILSEHYNKLVTRSEEAEDDFITLKRADHALTAEEGDELHLSNRKLRAGQSKKKMASTKGSGNKLVFDQEGDAHPMYELENEEDFVKAGGAKEQGKQFVDAEREVMKARDLVDKERLKEKKREKKRKRKDLELNQTTAPELDSAEEGDGYQSPVFDLPTDDEADAAAEEEVARLRNAKKVKRSDANEDMEALALKALGRGR